jgi:ABC-type bacteriocin/lantibiotic exporter with double-glycine peptidase domain
MKVKLNDYEIDTLIINSLFRQRYDYDAQTNRAIDGLLLQVVQKVKHKKLCRRQKFRFEPQETKLIRMCLIQWRNQQLQAQKQGAADAISDLIILFSH